MRFALLAIFLILGTPAIAGDYLIFPPGADTGQRWIGPEPKPGIHCPNDSVVLPFEIVNNDFDVHNYKPSKDNERLEWIDRVAEERAKALANPPVPPPNPRLFLQNVTDNPMIPPTLYGVVGTLMSAAHDEALRKKTWLQFKSDISLNVSADAAAAIEAEAATANMSLK